MLKCFSALGITLLVLIGSISQASAQDDAFTKFGRGMANIVLSPGELYTQPVLLAENHPVSMAFFGGLMKGTVLFLAREIVGVYEVVTFPFPIPQGYKTILKPATTFTDWDARRNQTPKD